MRGALPLGLADTLTRGARSFERTVDSSRHPERDAPAGERNERDVARLDGFEAQRRARGNVEPAAVGGLAVEPQRRVDFEEMRVGPDLDRTIARVLDAHAPRDAPRVQLDVAVTDEILAGNHDRVA